MQEAADRPSEPPPPATEAPPIFSTVWFDDNIPRWAETLRCFRNVPVRALEIGSFEGRSARWFMENIATHPEARLSCVDPWPDNEVFGRFLHNLAPWVSQGKVRPFRSVSIKQLCQFMVAGQGFDFIYVDGSHIACDVAIDAAIGFELLRPGGVMFFDDYLWGDVMSPNAPKMAVDAFLRANSPRLRLLFIDMQVGIQKL